MAGSWALNGFGMFSVIEKASGLWLGRIGPWRPDGWPGNEVGWGLVSEYPLGRLFSDLTGFMNQRMAAVADEVYLVACGLPLKLK